jgi:hypothetical protein
MKTRTLRNSAIGLLIVLAAIVGYLLWEEASASSEAKHATDGSKAVPARAAGESPQPATGPGAAAPKTFSAGANQPTRPLTAAEKEKVAAAMQDFRAGLMIFMDEAGRSTVAALLSRAQAAGGISDPSFEDLSLRLVRDASAPKNPEIEQIELASKHLSKLLEQFETGSPAWREARRQGEHLMSQSIASTKKKSAQIVEDMGIQIQASAPPAAGNAQPPQNSGDREPPR